MIYYFIIKLNDEIIAWGAAKNFQHHGRYERFHDFSVWTHKAVLEGGEKYLMPYSEFLLTKKKFGDYMINLSICQLFLIAKKKWQLIETNMAKMNLLSWEKVMLKM